MQWGDWGGWVGGRGREVSSVHMRVWCVPDGRKYTFAGGIYSVSVSLHKYSVRSLAATITVLFTADPDKAAELGDAVVATLRDVRALDPADLAGLGAGDGGGQGGQGGAEGSEAEEEAEEADGADPGDVVGDLEAGREGRDGAGAGTSRQSLLETFHQACHAVVAIQRKALRTSRRENSYCENLMLNAFFLYHPARGAGLPFPAAWPPLATWSLDGVLERRQAHMLRVLDTLSSTLFRTHLIGFFDLTNYVHVCLTPEEVGKSPP